MGVDIFEEQNELLLMMKATMKENRKSKVDDKSRFVSMSIYWYGFLVKKDIRDKNHWSLFVNFSQKRNDFDSLIDFFWNGSETWTIIEVVYKKRLCVV